MIDRNGILNTRGKSNLLAVWVDCAFSEPNQSAGVLGRVNAAESQFTVSIGSVRAALRLEVDAELLNRLTRAPMIMRAH